jgi:hypothetical protein
MEIWSEPAGGGWMNFGMKNCGFWMHFGVDWDGFFLVSVQCNEDDGRRNLLLPCQDRLNWWVIIEWGVQWGYPVKEKSQPHARGDEGTL